MTIDSENDLIALKRIGSIVARTLAAMGAALEPGMTARELDQIGAKLLEAEGARSAPMRNRASTRYRNPACRPHEPA